MGYVPLEPPVQRGWKRTFVLRADVASSAKAVFYQGILDKINRVDYHQAAPHRHQAMLLTDRIPKNTLEWLRSLDA
jgi:hypothetical protein